MPKILGVELADFEVKSHIENFKFLVELIINHQKFGVENLQGRDVNEDFEKLNKALDELKKEFVKLKENEKYKGSPLIYNIYIGKVLKAAQKCYQECNKIYLEMLKNSNDPNFEAWVGFNNFFKDFPNELNTRPIDKDGKDILMEEKFSIYDKISFELLKMLFLDEKELNKTLGEAEKELEVEKELELKKAAEKAEKKQTFQAFTPMAKTAEEQKQTEAQRQKKIQAASYKPLPQNPKSSQISPPPDSLKPLSSGSSKDSPGRGSSSK